MFGFPFNFNLNLPPIITFVIGPIVGIAVFLVIREITTWYWKINRMEELLEEIAENTSGLKKSTPPPPEPEKKLP